jgi:hypothetical protein
VSAGEVIAIALAGAAAGAINTLVGSGTLITFPVLLAFGLAPVTANVSNNIGLVPGSASGAWGYRSELTGQHASAQRLVPCSLVGAVCGAVLLLALPARAFEAVIPFIIALALGLIVAQPLIGARLAARARERPAHGVGPFSALAVFVTGIYGGYFGAAQGILLLSILTLGPAPQLQRANALKNVLAGCANAMAGLVFVFVAHVAWLPALLIALGSVCGAQVAARYGRRLSPLALRALIVCVGVAAIVKLVA